MRRKKKISRQAAWAISARRALIRSLGGRCVSETCSVEGGETDISRLEIDHVNGTERDLAKLSSNRRVALYRREAKEGKLRVLCRSCNARYRPTRRQAAEDIWFEKYYEDQEFFRSLRKTPDKQLGEEAVDDDIPF